MNYAAPTRIPSLKINGHNCIANKYHSLTSNSSILSSKNLNIFTVNSKLLWSKGGKAGHSGRCHIRMWLRLPLGWYTRYHNWGVSRFFSVPSGNAEIVLPLDHNDSFQILYYPSIIPQPIDLYNLYGFQ